MINTTTVVAPAIVESAWLALARICDSKVTMHGPSGASQPSASISCATQVRGYGLRIAHVVTRIEGGGTEKNLAASLETERSRGHDCTVIVGSLLPKHARRINGLAKIEICPQLQREIRPVQDLSALRSLRASLTGYDVVHSHQSKAGVLARLASHRRSIRVHTVHMASFGPGYDPLRGRLFARAEKLLGPRTDFLCFVGHDLEYQYLSAGIMSRHPSRILRSAIDVQAFAHVRELRSGRRSGGNGTILAVGALERRKRYDLMLAQIAPILRADPFVIVNIAGEGLELEDLERRVREMGVETQVNFLGHVSDVPRLMTEADVLVHTSAAEGVPQALLQAAIAGLPAVATKAEGLLEIGAGAVTVVHRTGDGLRDAVMQSLREKTNSEVPISHFDQWRPANVSKAYDELLRDIETQSDTQLGRSTS